MGRLADFRYREIVKQLKSNEATDHYTTIPNHSGDMPEGTLRAILKEAGISPPDFLKKKGS